MTALDRHGQMVFRSAPVLRRALMAPRQNLDTKFDKRLHCQSQSYELYGIVFRCQKDDELSPTS